MACSVLRRRWWRTLGGEFYGVRLMAVVGVSQGDGSLSSLVPGHTVLFVEKARVEAESKTRGVPAALLMVAFLLEVQLLPPSTPGEREVCGDRK